jgi:F-type H+-transporting ATPase subunit b
MPQLDASTFASQIFWLVVAFAVLFYLLRTKALPRVAEILEARQDRIANDLDRAAALRAEAEQALASYEQLVAGAQERARAEMKALTERIAAEAAEREAAVGRDVQARLDEAAERIAGAKRTALAELEQVAVEASQAAVLRLIGVEVTRKAAESALRATAQEAA